MQQRHRGFTLIEALIVITIIGIMAAIAIPAYQNYVIRGQVAEGLMLSAGAKGAVADYFAQAGEVPQDRQAVSFSVNGADTSGRYVSQVNIVDGRVEVTFGLSANTLISGAVLSLTPYMSVDHSIVWRCANADAPAGASLLGTGSPRAANYDAGSLAALDAGRYLPTSCRTGS